MSGNSGIIMVFDIKIMSLESGYEWILCLSDILDAAGVASN